MNRFLLTFLLLASYNIYSQKGFDDWDKKYKLVDLEELIKSENEYAKKVEADPNEAQYYVAMHSFRFIGNYQGQIRDINQEKLQSIKNVLKFRTGKNDYIDNLVSKEILVKVNSITLWMPIQNQLITPFKNEVKKNDSVLLYALFTNEHRTNKTLINSFLISEFTIEWK